MRIFLRGWDVQKGKKLRFFCRDWDGMCRMGENEDFSTGTGMGRAKGEKIRIFFAGTGIGRTEGEMGRAEGEKMKISLHRQGWDVQKGTK